METRIVQTVHYLTDTLFCSLYIFTEFDGCQIERQCQFGFLCSHISLERQQSFTDAAQF